MPTEETGGSVPIIAGAISGLLLLIVVVVVVSVVLYKKGINGRCNMKPLSSLDNKISEEWNTFFPNTWNI